jgi:hypothetical protein
MLRLILVVATLCVSLGGAQGQTLVDPYTTTSPAVTEPAQPMNPYPNPYGYYPPPATAPVVQPPPLTPVAPVQPYNPYGTVGCMPQCCVPCPPQPQGYYYYPQAPLYYSRPVVPVYRLTKPVVVGPRIRRFSLGVHGTVMGVSQKIGDRDMVMGGAGIQLRIRSKGRFGFELKQDFLKGSFMNGEFERSSYPFAFSLMLYVFPNEDTRHFNIYFLAGLGAMADSVRLRNPQGYMVTQNFLEGLGQLGAGLELRWKWFAIAADARFLGLIRDSSTPPGSYYGDIDGAPVPKKSWGWQGNAYINFWF